MVGCQTVGDKTFDMDPENSQRRGQSCCIVTFIKPHKSSACNPPDFPSWFFLFPLLLLRTTLLVLGAGLREDDGGTGSAILMLLLHTPGLGGASCGRLVVDVHGCTTVRSRFERS